MFRLSIVEDPDSVESIEDIDLPVVPEVGDVIEIDATDADALRCTVKSRIFIASLHNGKQVDVDRPMVTLVVTVQRLEKKSLSWV